MNYNDKNWIYYNDNNMSGNPRNPLYQKAESKLSTFDMENYIENIVKKKIVGKKYDNIMLNNVEFK